MRALGRRELLRASALGGLAAAIPSALAGCASESTPVALGAVLEDHASPFAFDARGFRWVLAPREGRLDVLDPDGARFAAFDGLAHPGAIAFDHEGRAWVVELAASRVALVGLDRGVLARHGGDVLRGPRDVAVDARGRVVIADTLAHHVVRFDAHGRVLDRIGIPGPGEGELNGPRSVALDRDETIVVAEIGGARVTRFDEDGTWLGSFDHPERFRAPRAVRIGVDGRIAVADAVRREVSLHARDGAWIETHRPTRLPEAITFAPDGALWISGRAAG